MGKNSGYSGNGRAEVFCILKKSESTSRARITVTIATDHNVVIEFLNLVVHDFIVQLSAHHMPHTRIRSLTLSTSSAFN